MSRTLLGEGNPLAQVENQVQLLRPGGRFKPFHEMIRERAQPLRAAGIGVFQMNLGRMCNQTCKHCHVDAGPDRKEIMTRATMEQCLAALATTDIPIVDLTGGAPELNPEFSWLVDRIHQLGRHVIDRCNLTILLLPRFADLIEFFAERRVEVVSSLPYYSAGNTDRQRGGGVFEQSIEALRKLNSAGYGKVGTELELSLVYNPVGAFLPPAQDELEATFRTQLRDRFGIEFTRLYVITNQPINRFLEYLLRSGNYEEYMDRLIAAFNPAATESVMCKTTISIGWDGYLYDCDFNQMLGLDVTPRRHIADFDAIELGQRSIVTGLHCYACTAGQGSSCTSSTA